MATSSKKPTTSSARKSLHVAIGILASIATTSAAQAGVIYRLSPPGGPAGLNQSSPFAADPGFQTETFDGLTQGALAPSGTLGVGSYTTTGATVKPPDDYGAAGHVGQYLFVNTPNNVTINTVAGSKYIGIWLSALNADNKVEFYGSGNTLLATFTAASIGSILGTPSSPNPILAIDGVTYSGAAYYANPNNGANAGEPYAYLNLQLDDPSLTFEKVVLSGTYFEFDNVTIGSTRFIDPGTPAPGPLPVVGGVSAVAWSRRLRRRIRSSQTTATAN